VFSERRKIASRHGALFVAENRLQHARLGIAVSRKVSRRAVERNRIKRQVREYFRHHHRQLGTLDVVFTAFPGCAALDNAGIRAMLDLLWRRTTRQCAGS
jgi:ribonuclease P protein component